jgi:hypothetical protein
VSFATVGECRDCLRSLSLPLPVAAADHPASVAFHWVREFDVLHTGVRVFNRYLYDGDWTEDRVADDPAEYCIEHRHDDATLRLFVDGRGAVTRTEHVRRRDHGEPR